MAGPWKPVSKWATEGATAAIPAIAHASNVEDRNYQFTYTGKAAVCDWSRYGIKIHFPANALPEGVHKCQVDIVLPLLCDSQFVLPDDAVIVSSIYSNTSTSTFTKAVTLEIQHSAAQTSGLVLKFVTANSLQQPFRVLEEGVFSCDTCYGRIETTHFCFFAIIAYYVWGFWDYVLGAFGYTREMSHIYTARLFYIRGGVNSWEVHLVITRDLPECARAIESHYSQRNARAGPHQPIEFRNRAITFVQELQRSWGVEHDGWKIVPLTLPPKITKGQVNRYMPGRPIPCCQFRVIWNRRDQAVHTHYLLWLIGDGGSRSFNIECEPNQ